MSITIKYGVSIADDDCWKEEAHTQLCMGPSNLSALDRAYGIRMKLKKKYGNYHAFVVVVLKLDSYHGHCWAHDGWEKYTVENACDNKYHMFVLTRPVSEQCDEDILEEAKKLTRSISVMSWKHSTSSNLCRITHSMKTKDTDYGLAGNVAIAINGADTGISTWARPKCQYLLVNGDSVLLFVGKKKTEI